MDYLNKYSKPDSLLTGNPYPSALDSEALYDNNIKTISDNTNAATNGTLYLWEHYSTNSSTI
jgi:hypothetical protein